MSLHPLQQLVRYLLNSVGASYIENLDQKQLNFGLWSSADLVLEDLRIKRNILDDLDLPVQIVLGQIGKVNISLPIRVNSAHSTVSIEDVYILLEPNQQVRFDPDLEEKRIIESKKKDIEKVELAKKAEAEKDKPQADDGMAVRYVYHVLKNIQITIKNIHIRYEDRVSNPSSPFAAGLTLSELILETTDAKWQKGLVSDATKIFKIAQLTALSIYWNCNTTLFCDLSDKQKIKKMRQGIATKTTKPEGYTYVFGPINSSARLRLIPNPERDSPAFSAPKTHLNLDMEKIFIGVSKAQYRDIIALVSSMDVMANGVPYRKFRPAVNTYTGNGDLWWQFAFRCVVEDVRRKRREWEWSNICQYRKMCKEYNSLFVKHLQNKTTAQEKIKLEECEKQMDITNILILRQKAEIELSRHVEATQRQSWMSWIFGSGKKSATAQTGMDIIRQFEQELKPEEKEKLYKAMDIQENSPPTIYPDSYIDLSATFLLRTLEIELSDDDHPERRILLSDLRGVKCKLEQRGHVGAMKLNVHVDDFTTVGLLQDGILPEIITPEACDQIGLLEILFETKPLDNSCDQRIKIVALPVRMIYDSQTFLKLMDIFKPPEDSALDQIQNAAGTTLVDVKEKTALGLQYAIEKHMKVDIDIDLHAPYIVVPYGGLFTGSENVFVANLGRVKIYSYGERGDVRKVSSLYDQGVNQDDIFKQMVEQCYDNFKVELTDVQLLVAQSDEDWRTCAKESVVSDMHLLNPLSSSMTYSKSLIDDDPRFPLSKVEAELPSIHINVSEARILLLMALISSVPLPSSESEIPDSYPLTRKSSSMIMSKYMDLQEKAKESKRRLPPEPDKKSKSSVKPVVQFTVMEGKFLLKEFFVTIYQQKDISSTIEELASLKVKNLECSLFQKTYDMNIHLLLNSINLNQTRNSQLIQIISTPKASGGDNLFKVDFFQADKTSPEFESVHKSCEMGAKLNFTVLNVILHQEGLLSLLQFNSNIMDNIASLQKDTAMPRLNRTASTSSSKSRLAVVIDEIKQMKPKEDPAAVDSVKFKLKVNLEEFSVTFATDVADISSCAIRGVKTNLVVKESCTQVNAVLKELAVLDLNPETYHKVILCGTKGTALTAEVTMNNLKEESAKPDMNVKVIMGRLRIYYLNWFVSNMLNFLNQFQAAQQAIIDASLAAAESAKENMKDAYVKAVKIGLDIHLKAPGIIVPTSSTSYDAVFLDLGVISLANQFITLEAKSREGYSAIVEDLDVSLKDFKLSRIRLDETGATREECALLEPLNLIINLKRNLSGSWFKAIPDLNVSGKITVIELVLSHSDYKSIMKILNDNLKEGKTEDVSEPVPLKSMDQVESFAFNKSHRLTSAVGSRTDVEFEGMKRDKVEEELRASHVFLKITFNMDRCLLRLHNSTDEELKSNINLFHERSFQLARFSLEGFTVQAKILSDSSIVANVLLLNILLDDMRPGREGKLTRLIERSSYGNQEVETTTNADEGPRSMIDVTYQSKDEDMFADIRIFSFTVIFSTEFFMQVAQLFSVPEETKIEIAIEPQVKPKLGEVESKKSVTSRPSSKDIKKKQPQMTINLKLEKPDIVLVEHMDSIDTKAMILNSEIMLKLRMTGTHQVVNGVIKDLELFTCAYNPLLRAVTKADILHPVTVSLAGSTPLGKGLHVELIITPVYLNVSATTIELLNKVMVTMSGAGTAEDQSSVRTFAHEKLWDQQRYREPSYWFLRTDQAVEALDTVHEELDVAAKALEEVCIISMPTLVITVQAGVENKTLPMLLLETGLKGCARNWSSQLSLEASLTMQMGYYNSRLALWEPLIEPVEVLKANRALFVPWELTLELSMNDEEELNATSPNSEEGPDHSESYLTLQPQKAVMNVDVTSGNNMEITVTKSFLEVLENLQKSFTSAMEITDGKSEVSYHGAPYKVLNEIGEDVTLLLEESTFQIAAGGHLNDINKLEAVPLQLRPEWSGESKLDLSKALASHSMNKNYYLTVEVNDKNCQLTLPVVRADKRYFMLNYRGEGHDSWGIISDVVVDSGVTLLTLRSVLQVFNHFTVAIDVYFMTCKGDELELIGVVEPKGVLNVPLRAVYTPTSEIFFGLPGYSVTSSPYVWKDLQNNLSVTKMLTCSAKDASKRGETFVVKVVGEMEQVYYENTTRKTMASACYNLHLRPAVVFKNFLPLDIVCCVDELPDEYEVKAGDTLQLPSVDPGKNVLVIRIPEYLEKEWSIRREISDSVQEFSVWTFNSYDSPLKMSLDLGVQTVNQHGSLVMTLYCPFWMINKTGLMLGYRSSDENLNVMHHPANFTGPILFSFNAKHFFGKKKACLRVDSGEWSDKFSLDAAGSAGIVSCKANDMVYQIGVHNKLTYSTLTKQVTFTPYYQIINDAPYPIECQENERPADPWVTVQPVSCGALWPRSSLEDKLLKLRVLDTEEVTAPFLYTESHNTLLKLSNKYGGINVDVQLTEGATYVSLAAYEDGSAPAQVINHTKFEISYWEKESVQKRTLEPKHSILFTWENPCGPRTFVWDKGEGKEICNDLRKDSCGEYSYRDSRIYWASFLNGMQRVLLFTESELIVEGAQASSLLEVIQQEVTVSLHGIGLSLVNNDAGMEIMYLGIASSGIIWQTRKLNSKRFKSLNAKESLMIEAAYQNFLSKQREGEMTSEITIIDSKTEVDFYLSLMLKPYRKQLKRTFQTGLWLHMKTSKSQTQLHAKINRLQIDNQIFDCMFPVVLAPVLLPKNVMERTGMKPFLEASIVVLSLQNSQVKQYKYCKILIQEMHVKIDMGFVSAVLELLQSADSTPEQDKEKFILDMKEVSQPLYSHATTSHEQKNFFDILHLSPIKFHLSFTMSGGSVADDASTPNFMKILLQGLGITLSEVQDVVFKLAYFQRDYTFLTASQVQSEVVSHYIGQFVKQLYVLVLGLDVIGNPYGLVLGITQGVEDLFYEPIHGAIEGPGEFAEGLALGVKSLLGHTVGGAAGAVSRITGAVGKGIAVLTFDDDYQRKRRGQMSKRATTVQEGLAQSGKGLVMGVYSGVTGVFTKPVAGAREQGVEGFFKGLGKGAVGLVTRPVAGVVDFASGSLDAVKRVADLTDEVTRLRSPRYLQSDGLVRPYNKTEADGYKILMELSKGKYAKTDSYVAHYVVIDKKEYVLMTDKRIAYLIQNEVFGGWQIEWSYTWVDLNQPAKVVPKGVLLPVSSEKKKKLFGSSEVSKTILISDPLVKEEMCLRIESLRSA